MSKITLTPADLLHGEPFKEGWVKAQITECVIAPNKAQDGVNYIVTLLIENDPDKRTIDRMFSSKAIGMIKPFLAALAGQQVAEFIAAHKTTGIDFDFKALIGKKLQIKIGTRMYENRPISEVQDFAPYDTVVPF